LTRQLADLALELLKSSRRSHIFGFWATKGFSKMHQKQLNKSRGVRCAVRPKRKMHQNARLALSLRENGVRCVFWGRQEQTHYTPA